MKKWFLLSFLLVFGPSAFGQKIGYVDSDRLRNEYKPFAEAKNQMDKEVANWQKRADSLSHNLKVLEDSLAKVALILSSEKRKEREEGVAKAKREYQQYLADTFGVGGRVERRNSELSKPLLDKVNAAIAQVALESNYDLIFDTVTGSVAYGRKNLDITDKVLEKLNAELGGKK